MTSITVSQFRDHLADITNKVAYAGDRIRIERNGKPIMALVSVEDLQLLEWIEDRIDLEDALKALKEPGGIILEELKKQLAR